MSLRYCLFKDNKKPDVWICDRNGTHRDHSSDRVHLIIQNPDKTSPVQAVLATGRIKQNTAHCAGLDIALLGDDKKTLDDHIEQSDIHFSHKDIGRLFLRSSASAHGLKIRTFCEREPKIANTLAVLSPGINTETLVDSNIHNFFEPLSRIGQMIVHGKHSTEGTADHLTWSLNETAEKIETSNIFSENPSINVAIAQAIKDILPAMASQNLSLTDQSLRIPAPDEQTENTPDTP
jgi:hypothetical protein